MRARCRVERAGQQRAAEHVAVHHECLDDADAQPVGHRRRRHAQRPGEPRRGHRVQPGRPQPVQHARVQPVRGPPGGLLHGRAVQDDEPRVRPERREHHPHERDERDADQPDERAADHHDDQVGLLADDHREEHGRRAEGDGRAAGERERRRWRERHRAGA
eukprot:1745837-Prymnesium_polylepis.1